MARHILHSFNPVNKESWQDKIDELDEQPSPPNTVCLFISSNIFCNSLKNYISFVSSVPSTGPYICINLIVPSNFSVRMIDYLYISWIILQNF